MPITTYIQKTPLPEQGKVIRQWLVVDAKGKILGDLATGIAKALRGKNKAIFTPHMDTGDFVIVLNARHIKLSGKKLEKKEFRWYTGYPGAIRSRSYKDMIVQSPIKVIRHAVWGMLPHNRLGRRLLRKLKVYADDKHPHAAQKPELLSF